jgi:ubiquinone/menaquinone biosynthesis C-methylase UbiE
VLLPQLQDLQSKLVDWSEDSSAWIRDFHIQLELYHRIYASDIYRRASPDNPYFEKYLREQYMARLRSVRACGPNVLYFSPAVYLAILRTGWQPNPVLWGDYRIEQSTTDDGAMEIARILVRPPETSRDRKSLEALDFDHRLFAIPLFVIDPKHLAPDDAVDFAIGFGSRSSILKCYEFAETVPRAGKVVEATLKRARELRDIFERILRNRELKTVSEWLGYYQGMIQDPTELSRFAENYDRSRRTNAEVLAILRKHVAPGPQKTGLEIGCGTGNYTAPFAGEFLKLIGLDISDEMLAIARRKSSAVTWVCGNALNNYLPDASCDAVWLISTLHYFQGDRQKLLFQEIHRLLKPGGAMVADTEFAEQHVSLWVVKFFPSLAKRYQGATFSTAEYRALLKSVGFSSVQFETLDATGEDTGIRIGQHHPESYLDRELRSGIPAFHEMDPAELDCGLDKLARAINDGSIAGIMREYSERATMPGDVGFIVARR